MTEILTSDQSCALKEIIAAFRPGYQHLLTGYAGSGKTTLMWHLTKEFMKRGRTVVLTAPTHKAVAVLRRKVREAGIDGVDCRTIQSLLSLRPKPHGDRMIFTRNKRAEPVLQDIVVVDECSMVDAALFAHIKRHLPVSFVVFVGDPAQLPPVGEKVSQTFSTKKRSHLDTIVRQNSDNPILEVASIIRKSQGAAVNMSWYKSLNRPPFGVFLPSDCDGWMKKAFTSKEFDSDPDQFRYLAWTNSKVSDVNTKIRRWRYGDDLTIPFMPDEMALFRAPLIIDGSIVFNTNEEARVISVCHGKYECRFPAGGSASEWTSELPIWQVEMDKGDGKSVIVNLSRNDDIYNKIVAKIYDEAADNRDRWEHLHSFKSSIAKLQSIYAMTVHTSQGSTFKNAFVDVSDIQRRASSNLLEAQQLFYVAATRPTHALILVGA